MELMKKLSNALAPSGHEQNIRALIEHEIKPYVDEITTDKFGNLVAHKKGTGPKVMLAAHMDEVGLMIKFIKDNGHMQFLPVGGVEPITLVGQRVTIIDQGKELCHGIVSFKELDEADFIEDLPHMSDLFIDTGITKKDLEKLGVHPGAYAVPYQPFTTLGNKDVIAGKALDDRIGCYVLIELAKKLKNLKNSNLYYVFTVQEEVGLYGAQTAIYNIDPDYAIAIDVTNAIDVGDDKICSLGCGPTLTMMDSEMIANPCLNRWLLDLAKKNHVPIQRRVEDAGTTDATRMMLSKGGVPATTVGVAVKNLHSTASIASFKDVQNLIKLLSALLKNPPKSCIV